MKRLAVYALIAACISGSVLVGSMTPVVGGTASAEEVQSCATVGDSLMDKALLCLADLHSAVDDSGLPNGITNSLDAKVDAATQSVISSRIIPALNQIGAFQNEVDGLTNGGKIDATTSNILKKQSDTAQGTIQNLK